MGSRKVTRVIATALVLMSGVVAVGKTPIANAAVTFYFPWTAGDRWYVSQDGGEGLHLCTTGALWCRAIDFDANAGQKVRASAAGTIKAIVKNVSGPTTYASYGNYVVLQHADGTCTRYARMARGTLTAKKVGATVALGEVLGGVGSTGGESGTRLHFQRERCATGVSMAIGFAELSGGSPVTGTWYTSRNGDADGDGVMNAVDACPSDAGAQGDGCPPPENSHSLSVGESLSAGNGMFSANNYFKLIMQTDGNLVLYRNWPGGGAVWSSRTWGIGDGARAVMQTDGNFVVYDSANRARWASNTFRPGSVIELSVYGELFMYNAINEPWTATNAQVLPKLPDTKTWYEIRNVNSGLCVDAVMGGTDNGTEIQQWPCNGSDSQKFKFVHAFGTYYQILRKNAGTQSLAVANGGSALVTYEFDGSADDDYWRTWFPELSVSGTWRFIRRVGEKCVDVPNASKDWGQRLRSATCNAGVGQSFVLTPAS